MATRAARSAVLAGKALRGKAPGAVKCRRKFLRFFPGGFRDETYLDWERDYKWAAHEQWASALAESAFRELIEQGRFTEIALRAVRIESRTNLLFSFEKMALRDAVRSPKGAEQFSLALFELLHGGADPSMRFDVWCRVIAGLPRRQTRVLTWPLATVFGFIAQPARHFFLKPMVTRAAAREYGVDFGYTSRPSAEAYDRLLSFARVVRRDLADLRPRDMIDIQSFLWVQGSDEYEE
ncbi:MAG TPA: hypothetical protein VFT04_05700 [Gemmatimonadales bacterium]|nr:hypothetical protein [Gemmatimonadales bacterium]